MKNQFTILLIENDSEWRIDVCARLRDAGYDVLTAASGDEGFCVARRLRPDLILCEAALPDISGVQLCYMIRADANLSAAPLVLIGAAMSDAAESFRAGASDYFEKDGDRQFLLAKIARLLDLQNVEAELRRRCRNLRRSERHLAKIIEDASNLVRVLDPAAEFAASPKSFFGSNVEWKKKTDDVESWKRLMQPKQSFEANKLESLKREKVYYEIVC